MKIKGVKKQKKNQLKYYHIVLYEIINLMPIKDIFKTLASGGIKD